MSASLSTGSCEVSTVATIVSLRLQFPSLSMRNYREGEFLSVLSAQGPSQCLLEGH